MTPEPITSDATTSRRMRRAPSRARPKAPARGSRWQKRQDEMAQKIAGHALEGGHRMLGDCVPDEQAIDAYLEVLRQDLIAFATKEA